MKKALKIAMLSSALALAGCATIVSDSSYPVQIKSDPKGAEFIIKNRAGEIVSQGTTPDTVQLKAGSGYFKGEKYQITFKKVGFEDAFIELDSGVDGWYWGNIGFGGLLGFLVIDPITGAMYTLPKEATTQLQAEKTPTLQIMDINKVSKAQRKKLKRIK